MEQDLKIVKAHIEKGNFHKPHLDWLIEKAEETEDQTKWAEDYFKEMKTYKAMYEEQKKENERLKGVVKWEISYEKQCLELQMALEKVIETNNKTVEKNERYKEAIKTVLDSEPESGEDWEMFVGSIKDYLCGILEGKW